MSASLFPLSDSSLRSTTPCAHSLHNNLPGNWEASLQGLNLVMVRGWENKQKRQFRVQIHCLMKQKRPGRAAESQRTDPSWKSRSFPCCECCDFFPFDLLERQVHLCHCPLLTRDKYVASLQTGQLCSCERLNWRVCRLIILITKTSPFKVSLFSLWAWDPLQLNFNFSITARHEAQTLTTSTCVDKKLCRVASWRRCLWNNVIGLLSLKNVEKGATEKLPKLMFCM